MKCSCEITSSSLSHFQTSLKNHTARVAASASEGMQTVGERFYARTQSVVPRRTQALAHSGHVTQSTSGARVTVTVGYGDATLNARTRVPTSEYAVPNHEVYNPMHPNSYKWLERALRQYGQQTFVTDLAEALRRAF